MGIGMDFNQAFDKLIAHEGGYVNDPADPGGETRYGISKRSYPDIDIKKLTLDMARQIYLRDFWLRGGMDKFDGNLAFQVFDFAVNSGIETALRKLQIAAGVADDGHIGPVSLSAIMAIKPEVLILRFLAERLDFMRKLSVWPNFSKGWAARIAADMRLAAEGIKI